MPERINLRNALGLDDPKHEVLRAEIRQQIEIAQSVYDLRAERGLTQSEMATLVGTTLSVIRRVEDSDYNLLGSYRLLDRITKALGKAPFTPLISSDAVQGKA